MRYSGSITNITRASVHSKNSVIIDTFSATLYKTITQLSTRYVLIKVLNVSKVFLKKFK